MVSKLRLWCKLSGKLIKMSRLMLKRDSNWYKKHERIMEKYVSRAVNLEKQLLRRRLDAFP